MQFSRNKIILALGVLLVLISGLMIARAWLAPSIGVKPPQVVRSKTLKEKPAPLPRPRPKSAPKRAKPKAVPVPKHPPDYCWPNSTFPECR